MTATRPPTRRALTLVELMLALVITAMIAGAIASMMAAVGAGVSTRRDHRSVMLRANAAQARLTAYIASSKCVLACDGTDVTIWYDDSRESDTIHASEVRWIVFDAVAGELVVHYVAFPDTWSEMEKELADEEYAANTEWSAILATYQAKGLTGSIGLVDGLQSVNVSLEAAEALEARIVGFALGFVSEDGGAEVRCAPAIRYPATPEK